MHRSKKTVEAENRRLLKENEALREENARLRKRVADLEALVERLEARIAILEKVTRSGPGGAPPSAPPSAPASRRRGRRPGHPGTSWSCPSEPPEVVELPLRECPQCGGSLTEWRDHQDHVVVDLPEIRPRVLNFRHERGYCPSCRKTVRSPRAPDEPPRGHLGLRLLSLTAELKTGAGMTYPKIARLLKSFGVELGRSTLSQAVQRVAEWLQPVYEALQAEVRNAEIVHCDETSWPVNGKNGWTWVFCNENTSLYVTEPSRAGMVPVAVLGEDFAGVLVSDFYAPYARIGSVHQYCWSHLLRESREVAASADPVAVHFREALAQIYRDAEIVAVVADTLPPAILEEETAGIARRLSNLRKGSSTNADVERLKNRLAKYQEPLLTFLRRPGVEPTNNRAEREIRPAVVVRKTSGGSRSWNGARAHAVVVSCERTLRRRGRDLLDALRDAVCPPSLRPRLTSVLPG